MTDKDVIVLYERGVSVEAIAEIYAGNRKEISKKKSRNVISEIILKHWREIVKQ